MKTTVTERELIVRERITEYDEDERREPTPITRAWRAGRRIGPQRAVIDVTPLPAAVAK